MKLTKTHLRQIIKEELQNILSEQYTTSDIRKMTPQQAQQAFAKLPVDAPSGMRDDLLSRSQGIGAVSSLDPKTFDPITKGVKWARENYPKTAAAADVLGSILPGAGETVGLADLRSADTDYEKEKASGDFVKSVALGAIPGGRAVKYAKGGVTAVDKAIDNAPKYAKK